MTLKQVNKLKTGDLVETFEAIYKIITMDWEYETLELATYKIKSDHLKGGSGSIKTFKIKDLLHHDFELGLKSAHDIPRY